MNKMTIQELKSWAKEHKDFLIGLHIRVTTVRGSFPFNTLKAFGEHILRLEEQNFTSATIYSYSTNGITFRNFSNDLKEISNVGIKSIEITIGGGLSVKQRLNLAKVKTAKLPKY